MIIDVVVVIVLLFSAAVSFWRGLIREVLTIGGIVGGIVASYVGGPLLIPHMRGWFGVVEGEEPQMLLGPISYEMAADATSYISILIVVIFILSFISHFISEFARNIGLGALDRTLGVAFGLARGILLLGVVFLLFSFLLSDEQKEEYLVPAKSYVYLDATAEWLKSYMPAEMETAMKETAEDAMEANSVRQKLQDMKLLEAQEGEQSKAPEDEQNKQKMDARDDQSGIVAPPQNPSGYNDQFRDDMNQLIEQNLNSADEPQDQ